MGTVKKSGSVSHSVMSNSCRPHGISLPGSSVHGDSPGKNTSVGCSNSPPEELPNPGIESGSPALQVNSLPSEPPGKLEKNRKWVKGVGPGADN